ncbi:DUF421 domain-containing protein [Neobacillus terrae]|uniref:DUF421 domain-containing protein n=1 Tax=Neobacillus terrae TaxID=3034837 RepID=UPI00140D0546|nr:YetF domain-containing protein [Neobacillus terrae]NHM31266.1 DUF421 domain-containing protein [Neobacillus terrae]
MELVIILLKLIMGFAALLFCLKVSGVKGLKNITPIDFIWSIMLSEIFGNGLYDSKVKWYYILAALLLWCVIKIIFDKLMDHSDKFEKIMSGDKVLLIENGIIDKHALEKCDIDLAQLKESLRKLSIFSFNEVDKVYLEADGSISVKKFPEYQPVTRRDLNIKT